MPVDPDRFAGCLVGQALGDALGFIVEGHGTAWCASYVADRELAGSLVACRGLDPADYAQRIAALFTENRIVGRGRATTVAAYQIAHGVAWQDAGAPPPSAGNGSAMRVAPVGLFFGDDPAAMVDAAHAQGFITHQDPRCGAGAVAIAGATAIAARSDRLDPTALCAQLAAWTAELDPVLTAALGELPAWLALAPDVAQTRIASVGLDPTLDDGWEGISPFVTPSVLWSIYAALRSPGDYWEAICTSIAVGGDVDTTAAMTGAIAGAHVGLAGIPAGPASLVEDQGTWDRDALVALAHELHAAAGGT